MGCNVKYGTIAVGAYYAHLPGALQPAFTDQYSPAWNRGGARGPKTRADKMNWISKWSFGCKIGFGDVSGADGAADGDMAVQDWFVPPATSDGSQSIKFIKGMCVDTSDVAISGASVQAFRTSDNTFGGYVVQSRPDGSYDVPTLWSGVAHFVVAYLAGSPDRTTATLNTLTPTNIDGT